MDESGRKDAEGDAPVEQQGIFSSPDLAINSENLEQIKPELSEDNKSRIASAFAMTDATQKHDQLSEQMAEQDAISGTVLPASSFSSNNSTASTVTGNIKIPSTKKKSKLPLILAVLVLTAIAAGVTLVVGGVLGSSEKMTASQAFESYMDYLASGSEESQEEDWDDSADNPEWLLFRLEDGQLSTEQQKQYLAELRSRYSVFQELVQKNTTDGLIAHAKSYGDILETTIKYHSIYIFEDELLEIYLSSGATAAYQYMAKEVPQETGLATDYLNAVSSTLRTYLEATLSMIEMRSENNCYIDGVLDSACSGGLYETNATYASVDKQQNTSWKTISRLTPQLDLLLQNETEEMLMLLKGANE